MLGSVFAANAQTTMLTLSKPLSWIEAWRYYREELQNACLNYYLPIVSSWHGQLARHWGLNKTVTEDIFATVAAGQDPRSGTVLVDDRRSRADINHRRQIPRAITHRAGWDGTVSAPISVSVTAIGGGDLRIHDAHRASVRTCLDELERFTQARIGGNHPPETTGRWIAALFEHDSAPPAEDDYAAPQLHTHVWVFNITTDSTGEARPLNPRELYRSQQYAAAIYLNELAYRLRGWGYELDLGAGGQFELSGYTRAYLAACRPEGVQLRRRAVESLRRLRGAERDPSHAQRQD
jgi:conjugative relaxase-like TrwC/TraI family protein